MPEENLAISKWLVFFGSSLLPPDEVSTGFANEIMSTIPADDRCRKFSDYIVDHYIYSGCDFAPDLWASSPQRSPTTSNAAESFHSHLNADIRTPHPNIYAFVQSLIRQQASTYVLTSSLAFRQAPSRTRSQKGAQLLHFYRASYASAVLGVVILFVCLSICHTRAL